MVRWKKRPTLYSLRTYRSASSLLPEFASLKNPHARQGKIDMRTAAHGEVTRKASSMPRPLGILQCHWSMQVDGSMRCVA